MFAKIRGNIFLEYLTGIFIVFKTVKYFVPDSRDKCLLRFKIKNRGECIFQKNAILTSVDFASVQYCCSPSSVVNPCF